jgi:hypothetical protein
VSALEWRPGGESSTRSRRAGPVSGQRAWCAGSARSVGVCRHAAHWSASKPSHAPMTAIGRRRACPMHESTGVASRHRGWPTATSVHPLTCTRRHRVLHRRRPSPRCNPLKNLTVLPRPLSVEFEPIDGGQNGLTTSKRTPLHGRRLHRARSTAHRERTGYEDVHAVPVASRRTVVGVGWHAVAGCVSR